MRFDLRLLGRTGEGKKCQADISVYAGPKDELDREAMKAAESAAWRFSEDNEDWVPEGSHITVEEVKLLNTGNKK